MLPGFGQGTWLAGGLVAIAVTVVAVAAEEEDAGDEGEGTEDGGEHGCVDIWRSFCGGRLGS